MASGRTKKSAKMRSTGNTAATGKALARKGLSSARCGFCNLGLEVEDTCDTLYVADDVAAHFSCMLYSSGLVQEDSESSQFEDFGMFDPNDVKNEIKRGLQLSCSVCHRKGATIGCDREKCTKSCHFKCGVEHRYMFQDNPGEGQFLMFCPRHKDVTSDAEDDDDDEFDPEEEEEEEQDSDNENTDPSWDKSPPKKSPTRSSPRKRGRPAGKKKGQKNGRDDESSPRRSKRARTVVKYEETDEESDDDEAGIIFVPKPWGPKKLTKKEKEVKKEVKEKEDADEEGSEEEDPGDEEVPEDGNDLEKETSDKGEQEDEDADENGAEEEEGGSGDEEMEEEDGDQKTEGDFWERSRKAGRLGAVCSRAKQAMQSALKKIQDNTATETEYAAVTSFMDITGLMKEEERKAGKKGGRKGKNREKKHEDETEEDQAASSENTSSRRNQRKGKKE